MNKNFTIMETREMDERRLQAEISKCVKWIEERCFGMGHEEACEFISSVMNLGIAYNTYLIRYSRKN